MKKGLKKFIELYDYVCEAGELGLDLAQNLHFKGEMAKPEYNKITKKDIKLAYNIPWSKIMDTVHTLAEILGYTREDYIENADKRRNKGNCNIYFAGEGNINCDVNDLSLPYPFQWSAELMLSNGGVDKSI